jgi:hypothetical protein
VLRTRNAALRPFTDDDALAYSRCQSDAPEIGEPEWGDLVLDGAEVYIETFDGRVFSSNYNLHAAARAVAERVLAIDDPDGIALFVQAFEVES